MPATATATLKPERYEAHEDREFVVFEAVPVWKEHTNDDGVKFGKAELEAVVKRCNRRIEDTGDFVPICIRHTDDDGERDPKVVGFAGPFFVGRFGKVEPKWAILCAMRIFKEDAAEARRYPRVSVEYWASAKDPAAGYFDPISLLGAETPELDLGIRYGKSKHPGEIVRRYTRELELNRYEAVAPGGTNTFVPGADGKKKLSFQKDAFPMSLSEDDLNQIVAAFMPTFEAMLDERIAALQPPPPPEAVAGESPEASPFDMGPHSEAMQKYMGGEDREGAGGYLSGLKDEDRDAIGKHYQALGDDDEEKKFYMAACGPGENMSDDDDTKKKPKEEEKDLVAKYRKQRDELHVKYEKLQQEHETTKKELTEARDGERKHKRYAKFVVLRDEGFVVDPDEEVKDTASFTDEQVDKHVDMIKRSYQRIPTQPLYRERPEFKEGDKPDEDAKTRQRYAKEARDLALEEGLSFDAAYKKVTKGKSPREAVVG